jgi:enoyl-CoA hydratase/carnithine racemase
VTQPVTTARAPLSLIKVETLDGVATISVNRPDVLNNINFVVLHQLELAFQQAIADPAVRGIVLGGEGKVFVVGADIQFFIRNIEAGEIPRIIKYTEAGHRLLDLIDRSPKPVVARAHGTALGAGVEFALACDYIVAAQGTTFGFPETGLGIYPGFGGTQRSARRLGVGLAKWMILTGKTLAAGEAWKIGLVDAVAPAESLQEACRSLALSQQIPAKPVALPPDYVALAQFFENNRALDMHAGQADTGGDAALARAMKQVGNKAPIALRLAEQMIEQGMRCTLAAGLQQEVDHVTEIFSTSDALLGLSMRAKKNMGNPPFVGR